MSIYKYQYISFLVKQTNLPTGVLEIWILLKFPSLGRGAPGEAGPGCPDRVHHLRGCGGGVHPGAGMSILLHGGRLWRKRRRGKEAAAAASAEVGGGGDGGGARGGQNLGRLKDVPKSRYGSKVLHMMAQQTGSLEKKKLKSASISLFN